MILQEFLEKLRVELTISKNSKYTIRNYINANSELLGFCKKLPSDITEDDVKMFMAKKLSESSSSSIIVFTKLDCISINSFSYSKFKRDDPFKYKSSA